MNSGYCGRRNGRRDLAFVGKLLEQDDVDALREGIRVLAQAVMETEVSTQIGAAPYERSTERSAYRNGYRTRRWDTRVGTMELKIPKVTAGAYFPTLLEPRRRAEKALHAVVVEAYVKGISTRKVDDLVRALNDSGAESPERWLHDYNYHRPHLAHAGRPPIAALNNVPSTPSPYGLPLIRIDLGRSANRFDEEVHVGSKSLHPIGASKEAELGGARCRRGDSTRSSPWS